MLYSVKQLRQIELSATGQQEPAALMRAAGLAAAQIALKLITSAGQPILVVAGPGNNGGDAMETAVHLVHAGHRVSVLHHPPKTTRSGDREQALLKAKACTEITWLASDAALENVYALVIDGLFGIGLTQQKIAATIQKQISQINALSCPILALDVPSGLNADTGTLVGKIAIQASHTITFIGDKTGLHTGDGKDYAGTVMLADLGIGPQLFPPADMELNRPKLFPKIFQSRRQNSNKGSNGTVELIGGAIGMQGAIVLAARTALHAGAGRVIAGFIESAPTVDLVQPEIMCRSAHQLPHSPDHVTVIGPGLGNSIASFDLVSRALLATNLLVMDADALNLMAQQPALMALCNGRDKATTLLTPHPLEAARLLACSVEEVQADRINAAKKLARRFSAVVILKGSGSVIAQPDGSVVINPTGNAGLATGGTGDVLAGACGAFVAQHRDIWQAALAATYLHGAAADSLVQRRVGPVGLCASELILEIRSQLNEIVRAVQDFNSIKSTHY
jgi:hydroxyethylthiazole kinase-like uncharacterized protein yjeF